MIAQKLKLNCKLNTGQIHKVKHISERYDLYLSNEPRNAKIGQELVNR